MKQGLLGGAALVVVAGAAFVLASSLFVVDETEQALVLRFGQAVGQPITTSGLKMKVPFTDRVQYIDKRMLDLDLPAQEVIASDQKRLVVDAFARYKITEPLRFYQSVGSIEAANNRLATFLNSSLRRVLGESTFQQVVRDERPQLMGRIRDQINREANPLGITVVDVKIRRADLPEQNSQAIFRRMETERQREAAEIRAQGAEAAQRIRSRADREVVVLTAEAARQGETLRGQGDAERNRVFAEAYGRDANFFAFYRSMQAYEQALTPSTTRLVLSPDSEFFRFFANPAGAARAGARP